MTRDKIEQRKATLVSQKEQLTANINAVLGAIQDCDFWLSALDQEEAESASSVSKV